jgi:hypothetical protein
VLQFCRLLRHHGIDVRLDRYAEDERRDWYVWYLDEIAHSDYVLIIASPGYRTAGDGTTTGTRRGVLTEAAHLRDLLHADRATWTRRLLPVVLPGQSVDHIPAFLQPSCASHYLIRQLATEGISDLVRILTRQPGHLPPVLGQVPDLPPIETPEARPIPAATDRTPVSEPSARVESNITVGTVVGGLIGVDADLRDVPSANIKTDMRIDEVKVSGGVTGVRLCCGGDH